MPKEQSPIDLIERYVRRLEKRVGELLEDIRILQKENKELKANAKD